MLQLKKMLFIRYSGTRFALLGGALLFAGIACGVEGQAVANQRSNTPSASLTAGHAGDPSGEPTVMATLFGGQYDGETDRFLDLQVGAGGSLYLSGLIHDAASLPSGVPVRYPAGEQIGKNSGMVARLTPDASEIEWISVLPAGMLQPEKMRLTEDGGILLSGTYGPVLKEIPQALNPDDWHHRAQIAFLKLNPDGESIAWATGAGPNQTKLSGMEVGPDGKLYWLADSAGRGVAGYILRLDPATGNRIGFSRGSLKDGEYHNSWAISFHQNDAQMQQEGQFGWFYSSGGEVDDEGFRLYGDQWPVRWDTHSIQRGGQIVFLPDGDFIVTGSLHYNFRVKGSRNFPAWDLVLARYSPDGELRWSTNLYQEGDSAHTPDQFPQALVYNPETDKVYVAARQHGSNIFRFQGELVGDTGNLMISWIGKVDASDGALLDRVERGWYWHTSREGRYRDDSSGIPDGWPSMSSSFIRDMTLDSEGRLLCVGEGGAELFTTDNAYKSWPDDLTGGGKSTLLVLNPDLTRLHFSSVFTEAHDAGGRFSAVQVTDAGVFIVGHASPVADFRTGEQPTWAADENNDHEGGAALLRILWSQK